MFGNRIRELREKKGLLLRQVAATLEVDTATVSKIELGTRNATREQVILLAKILDQNQNDLLALWLGNKIHDLVKNEPQALDALNLVENIIKKGNA